MSSPKFSSELTPDRALRNVVRGAAVCAGCAGCVVILQLPFAWPMRIGLLLIWCAHSVYDLVHLAAGQRQCLRIRIGPDRAAQIVTADGCCSAATLLSGSVVYQRLAWLRLRTVDGRKYRELVAPKSPQNEDWRRFQVIWRHLGGGL